MNERRDSDWLFRTIGACAVVAAVLGVVVAPGLHGNATDSVVNFWDHAAAIFSISGGFGRSSSPYAFFMAERMPRSPTGNTSFRRRANMRNI